MSTSATDAPCRHCGGPVPIVLAGPDPRCEYCSQPEPLEPALASRVQRLRQQIAAVASRQQRMVERQSAAADMYAGWLTTWSAFLVLCLYALVPALVVGTIPESVGFIDFYVRGRGVDDGELLSRWWFFWSFFSTLAGLVAFQRAYATLRALQLTPSVLPRPPRAAGEPPTCRVCGGPLTGRGRVQPCTYCGATHLVTGAHLEDHARTVDDRLQSLEAEATRAAERGQATSLSLWVGTMTLTLFGPGVAVAVGHFVVEGPRPELWGVTVGLFVLAAVATGLSRVFAFPSVPHPNALAVGDLVVLRGDYRPVVARVGGVWGGILLIFEGGEQGLLVDYDSDEGWKGKTVTLAGGGDALTTRQVSAEGRDSELWPVDVRASDGSLLAVGRAFSHPGPQSHQLRIWGQRPAAGAGAQLTLSQGTDLQPREFLIVGPP